MVVLDGYKILASRQPFVYLYTHPGINLLEISENAKISAGMLYEQIYTKYRIPTIIHTDKRRNLYEQHSERTQFNPGHQTHCKYYLTGAKQRHM